MILLLIQNNKWIFVYMFVAQLEFYNNKYVGEDLFYIYINYVIQTHNKI